MSYYYKLFYLHIYLNSGVRVFEYNYLVLEKKHKSMNLSGDFLDFVVKEKEWKNDCRIPGQNRHFERFLAFLRIL